MKSRKRSIVVFLLATMLLFAAGCGSSGDPYVLPTHAPTRTPVPEDEANAPTPTVAPDAEYARVIELDGEDFNQTSNFTVQGQGNVSVKPISYTGSYAFYVSNRSESWDGPGLPFVDKEGNNVSVTGKRAFISAWVYHETGKSESFTCTLMVKRPDGIQEEAVTLSKQGVKSGTWTLFQGALPIYANVTDPVVRLAMSSSKEPFYFDDIRLTYDEGSTVQAKAEYNVVDFDGLYYDFEDETHDFIPRGGVERLQVKNGGAPDGKKYLHTSGRNQNWHAPSIDLSSYGLAGTTIWVSFTAAHEGEKNMEVLCTVEELAFGAQKGKNETYAQIGKTKSLAPGEWGEFTGKITVKANTESLVLYFETLGKEDIKIDNVMITAKDPATLEVDKNTGEIGEKVEKMDTTGYEVVHYLTADGAKGESGVFINNNAVSISTSGNGKSENGFLITDRTQTYSGVGLNFTNLNGESFDVAGKNVFVGFWVYQDSGKPIQVSATLQVTKPDGKVDWPERVNKMNVPSGEWTYIEGLIPIYANASNPQINFETPESGTPDFILDSITVAFDPKSNVPANKSYADSVGSKKKLDKITLGFDDNNAFFVSRGDGKPSIKYGGYESEKCLFVSGRKSNWHGVAKNMTDDYNNISGHTVTASFWLYHEYEKPLDVILSIEQVDDSNTTSYVNVVNASCPADGKWAYYTGTYYVPENMKQVTFYFESPDVTAEFYIDDVTFEVED